MEASSYRHVARRAAAGESVETDTWTLWMMHTREFVEDWSPRENMWEDWAIA